MMKEKKNGKLIARITARQESHLENRIKTEKKTLSELIRELIDQDKTEKAKVSGLSLKSIHEKKRQRHE